MRSAFALEKPRKLPPTSETLNPKYPRSTKRRNLDEVKLTEAAGKTETKGRNEASNDPASGVDHLSQGFGLRDYYDY